MMTFLLALATTVALFSSYKIGYLTADIRNNKRDRAFLLELLNKYTEITDSLRKEGKDDDEVYEFVKKAGELVSKYF